MKKTIDIQPWLDYFDMLATYENCGYLEVSYAKHEAYITETALFALTNNENGKETWIKAVSSLIYRIKAYAAWKGRFGQAFMDEGFALHVVKDSEPHDLLYTLLMTIRRRWWSFWTKKPYTDIIRY